MLKSVHYVLVLYTSPREVTKRRRPRRCRPAARGAHAAGTEIGKRPKLASLRQRTLLYPISAPATWRHQRGFHCNSNGNGNGNGNSRCAERQATATVAARATATSCGNLTHLSGNLLSLQPRQQRACCFL